MAPLLAGGKHFPISITVLEEGPEFLFGLDNLRRHQCVLDLQANALRFPASDVVLPFLPEHEIPKNDLFGPETEGFEISGSATKEGASTAPSTDHKGEEAVQQSSLPSGSAPAAALKETENEKFSGKIDRLTALGFSRQECEAALKAADGNEDIAASLLFGGL